MKTNDEIVEEKARVLIAPGIGVRYLTEEDVRTILTQKDAEVAVAIKKYRNIASPLSEEFDRGYVTACDDILRTPTPHPTDDTSGKSK